MVFTLIFRKLPSQDGSNWPILVPLRAVSMREKLFVSDGDLKVEMIREEADNLDGVHSFR